MQNLIEETCQKPQPTVPAPQSSSPLLKRLASLAGDVFSPLLMATYAIVIALWLTPMNRLPFSVRAWSAIGIFFITCIIPAGTVILLLRMGRISDVSISDRRQRPFPFMVGIICYIIAGVFLAALKAPYWLVCFFIAATLVAVVELIVSLRWKISAHAGAAGGLLGFVWWLCARNALIGDPFILLSAAILITGIVCWARMYMRHHTFGQVCAGTALGFACEFLMLMY